MTTFRSLSIEGWRQFASVHLELHPRLSVLTGANGSGKSTLLRIFSSHFGFARPFLSTPRKTSTGGFSYFTDLFRSRLSRFIGISPQMVGFGAINYSNGVEAALLLPEQNVAAYGISIANQQPVSGIHIDSHHVISPYQPVGQIPTNLGSPQQAYDTYNSEVLNKYHGGHTGYSPLYRMKESIIAMALFGEGNRHVQRNDEILAAYTGFVDALRVVLPPSLGFLDLSIRPPEVVIVTTTGEFLLDAASGGVAALIDLTWRLHMFSVNRDAYVVTIDEPENHLHPTMQRTLLNRLLDAFPKAQFIVATHSPFMVSAVRDSNVYVLRYRALEPETGALGAPIAGTKIHVHSERLDTVNKAATANEILREVLGVSATTPEWVEDALKQIIDRYRGRPLSSETISELRSEVETMGYGDIYPRALAAIADDS